MNTNLLIQRLIKPCSHKDANTGVNTIDLNYSVQISCVIDFRIYLGDIPIAKRALQLTFNGLIKSQLVYSQLPNGKEDKASEIIVQQ